MDRRQARIGGTSAAAPEASADSDEPTGTALQSVQGGPKGDRLPCVSVERLRKEFNGVVAVNDITFDVKEGEFISLLGPSGCGKTTTLRLIAGLERPDGGAIRLGSDDVTRRAPYQRDIGVIFQSYALFPNMSVEDNVAYGLRARRKPEKHIAERVAECLQLVHLGGFGRRFPAELSGGQQQRVAVARSIAIRPRLLLLDEPLSNLDAKLRLEMRDEIRRIQKETGTTAIFVTHDQEEAMSISDRLVCMNAGHIDQIGSPTDVYNNPATPFVASFVGRSTVFAGTAETSVGHWIVTDDGLRLRIPPSTHVDHRDRALLIIKEERIVVLRPDESHENELEVTCESSTFLGSTVRYKCSLDNGQVISATRGVGRTHPEIRPGDRLRLGWSVDDASLIKVVGGGA